MRFYSNEEKVVVVSELKGIQCHRCGNIFNPYDESIIPVDISCGQFGNWKQDLCQECLFKIVKEFMIVPEGFMKDPSCDAEYDTNYDLRQQLFDEWKETGEWNYSENPYADYYPQYTKENEEESLTQVNLKVVK